MNLFDSFRARFADHGTSRASLDPARVTDTIRKSLASAGLETGSGPMKDVTDTIERALASAGLLDHAPHRRSAGGRTFDGTAEEVRTDHEPRSHARRRNGSTAGQFLARSFTSDVGTLAYKLYVPARHAAGAAEPAPLVVMLHGCTQSPDDFAAGTRMNALAEQHGFLVAYPGQSRNANGSNCWNWFKAENHGRDGSEPSLIAGVAREVAEEYALDGRRVFVAGLSAGAAMAVILGETYPELFAAVGAHSGLPYAAAHDVQSAYAAMNGGNAMSGVSHLGAKRRMRRERAAGPRRAVPTIVFHGDADGTVSVRNGAEIAQQAVSAIQGSPTHDGPLRRVVVHDAAVDGRSHERTVFSDATGRPLVEQWLLHGAGHAWSGGSRTGSFTDPQGPDASAEMIRFFFAQQSPRRLAHQSS